MSDELVEAVAATIACNSPSGLQYPWHRAAALAIVAEVIERCAKVADKRADDRFAEHGVTEYDTNASYYSGSRAEAYDELDEEDWAIARDIRKLGESDDRG